MERKQRSEIPFEMGQLAEQYGMGQPLAFYVMHPWRVRFFQVTRQVLLILVLIAVLVFLTSMVLFLYQLYTEQIADLQIRLIVTLPSTFIALIGCVGSLMFRYAIAQDIPASILVCTEGLLELRPKEIEVTHWDEVKESLKGPGLEYYKLHRINRKPFTFGKNFENVEDLADLVRQYTQKQSDS